MRYSRLFAGSYFLVLHVLFIAGQSNPCKDLQSMLNLMGTHHVQPRATMQGLSADVPQAFFEMLDPSGLFLTREDRMALDWKQDTVYQEDAGCALLKKTTVLYKKRLHSGDSILAQLAAKAPSYTTDEHWTDNVMKAPACSQADRMRQMVKLQILESYLPNSDTSRTDDFSQAEPLLRAQVCERMRCRIKRKQRMPEGLDRYIANLFLDAVANSYDPHSAFFTQDAKNAFESGLSLSARTFGLWVNETDAGEIAISYLTPAGPAKLSKKLRTGDIVTFMRFGGSSPINIACTYADEINEKLAAVPAQRLVLRVRHADGETAEVSLQAAEMAVEENVVHSLLLEDSTQVGYVYLPGFYSDWGSDDMAGCAQDVAREVVALKNAGVKGVILDLRGNGGGSTEEAVQLAGIFIEDGPLGMFVDRRGGAAILRDRSPGAVYQGPLVVLVDSRSASASEIFAAIMQDYHRAVIVGDTTYGKSTAQGIYPLPGNSSAFVKITTNHFCRITGHSHQGTGVYPDVTFPLSPAEEEHESDLPSVLSPAIVLKKQIRFQAQAELPASLLRQQAEARSASSPAIAAFERLNQQFADFYSDTESLLLQPDFFLTNNRRWQQLIAQSRQLDSLRIGGYTAQIPKHWQPRMETQPQLRETLQELRKDIQRDIEVNHAFEVMLDLLKEE